MRCFECLGDVGDKPFAVLKQMREFPADTDPVEARQLHGLLFDPVVICAACAGWHGDHAIPLTLGEAQEIRA